MKTTARWFVHVAGTLIAAGCLGACASDVVREQRQVDERLALYVDRVRALDHSGIAALFAVDGEIVNPGQAPIVGRSRIDRFLAGFSGFRVLLDETVPTSTTVDGNTARQSGHYRQRVRTPDGTEVEVSGHFSASWVRSTSGPWLIQSMETTPDPARGQ